MRLLFALVLALTFVACSSTASTAAPTPSANRTIPPTAAFVEGAELLVAPAEPNAGSCGLVREYKIGGRVNPPMQQSDGSWRISGCFYSHGNELWRTEVVLLFDSGNDPGAQRVMVVPVRDFVPKGHREIAFGTTLWGRSNIDRLRAFLVAYVH